MGQTATRTIGLTVLWILDTFLAEDVEEGVMVWGAFSARGMAALVSLKGSMGSVQYVKVLKKSLLPFATENDPKDWTFQQNNASIQSIRHVLLKIGSLAMTSWLWTGPRSVLTLTQ